MVELKFFYPNCDCCSGSGSSGSGPCNCVFYKTVMSCPSETHCPTDYVATIRLNFSGCGSSPIGSCGSSGSSGSDTEPTLSGSVIPIGTGSTGSSGSGSDCRICPSCCTIANKVWQINLRCVDAYLASDNIVQGAGSAPQCFGLNAFGAQSGSDTCLGFRGDRCNTGWVGLGGGGNVVGWFTLALDGGFLYISAIPFTLSNCDPFLMSAPVFGVGPSYEGAVNDKDNSSIYSAVFPCLSSCIGPVSMNDAYSWTCVTGTVTVTEASTGSGGGGGGGPTPPV